METTVSILALIAAIASSVSAAVALGLQSRHKAEDFHISWNKDVIDWSNSCVESLTMMTIAVESGVALSTIESLNLRSSLSSLIDQGRLLFENEKSSGYGANKPSAYQGYRPTMLDNLVRAYDNFSYALKEDYPNLSETRMKQISNSINLEQREFVSEIQDIIDPAWFFTKAKNFKKEPNAKNQ